MTENSKSFTPLLIVGCNGQLGRDMMLFAANHANQIHGCDLPDIDITSYDSTGKVIKSLKPELIINCAAYAAVDACETNRETAFAINETGAHNLARWAAEIGATLVHISTDYVFDGNKDVPYIESDEPNPQSVYGQSKLAGERRIAETTDKYFIFRIAWLYGNRGKNFVKTILRAARERENTGESLKVVSDQVGSPTYTMEVCRQIFQAAQTNHYGLFHSTAEGSCSWYEFTRNILNLYGINTPVTPCTTKDFPRPAPRPTNSVLENKRLKEYGINIMKNWKDAFSDFFEEAQLLRKEQNNE
ncbi:MAG: dTDP-4-dehydrorhamnose reductase [Chitinivibrionales bacterium]|nr:dTDP-4-dehydrorhamnose reductase [Chitinivibrionales bacterium]